jgi:uncharacterized membrane protein YdjX (TVP38/TMEM64 family)
MVPNQKRGLSFMGDMHGVTLAPITILLVILTLMVILLCDEEGNKITEIVLEHSKRGFTPTHVAIFVIINVSVGLIGATYGPGMLIGGFLFGFWGGFLVAALVEIITASTCFFLGRYVLRSSCRSWYEAQSLPEKIRVIIGQLEHREQSSLIFFRALPLPGVIKNYVPALLDVSFWSYLVAVFVEILIYVPWLAYIGAESAGFARIYAKHHGSDDLKEPFMDLSPWPPLVVSMVSFLILSNLAAKEVYRDDVGSMLPEAATVLTPLAALEAGHEPSAAPKPFLEHQRL